MKMRTFPSLIWFHPYFLLPWPHPSARATPSDPDARCKTTDQLTQSVQLRSFYNQLSTESSIHEPIHAILGYPHCRTGVSTSWVNLESRQKRVRCGYGSQSFTALKTCYSYKIGAVVSYPHTLKCREWRGTHFTLQDFQALLRKAAQRIETPL